MSALTETFITRAPAAGELQPAWRPAAARGETGEVTVDDAAVFIGRTDGGALGHLRGDPVRTGRKNAMRIEVNGSRGRWRSTSSR